MNRLLRREVQLAENIRGKGDVLPPYCVTEPILQNTDALIAEVRRNGKACGAPDDVLQSLAKLREIILKRASCDYGVGQGPLVPGAR